MGWQGSVENYSNRNLLQFCLNKYPTFLKNPLGGTACNEVFKFLILTELPVPLTGSGPCPLSTLETGKTVY